MPNPGHVQLILSGYLVGFSLALFVVGSVGCALSNTAWQMTGWRVV